jgi:hypothetical protein
MQFVSELPKIIQYLEHISHWSESAAALKAKTLVTVLHSAEFGVCLQRLRSIFAVTFQKAIPEEDLGLGCCQWPRFRSFRCSGKSWEMYDKEFALVFDQIKELSDEIQLSLEVPRITQRQVHQNNPPHTSPEEYYQHAVFLPMLYSVISDLKSQFSRDTLNSFWLTILLPSNIVNCTDDLL